MGRVTTRKPVQRITRDGLRARPDTLAVEEPLEIRVGGQPLVVTMRTPGHDVELATGFLFTEGFITRGEDVRGAIHCGGPGSRDPRSREAPGGETPGGKAPGGETPSEGGENTYNVLDLTLRGDVPAPKARTFYTTSSCGVCGKESIDEVRTASTVDIAADTVALSPTILYSLPERLRTHQAVFSKTGGTHAAGLFTYDGEVLVVREDVGRHNAVDKVIGWAALAGNLPLTETVLQVSGRASFELLQKAAMAGIPVFGAVSAPSSLAVDMAEEAGITLAGFMRGEALNLYAHSHRLGV